MYFITCFEKCGTNKGWLDIGASRTFGYYDNLNTCIQALNQNWCDMFEYLYEYAIVEKIGPGIHPECEERWFLKNGQYGLIVLGPKPRNPIQFL